MTDNEADLKEKFHFKTSLRYELFYAMQVFLDEDSKIHAGWKKRLSLSFSKKVLRSTSPISDTALIWPVVADILNIAPLDAGFDQIKSFIEDLESDVLQREIIEGLIHDDQLTAKIVHSGDLDGGLAKVPKKKQEWLAHVGLYPFSQNSSMAKSLQLLLSDPKKFKQMILDLLSEFWRCDFANTWQNMQPSFEKSRITRENLFHTCELEEFARQTLLKIEFDSGKGLVKALRGGATTPYKKIESGYIIPSAFNEKRFWTAYDQDKKTHIYIPLFDPSLVVSADGPQVTQTDSDLDPYLIFKALGDTTRFAIMKILAEKESTSLEISKSLSLSKPTISHHVHLLRQAELILEAPKSGSNILSINYATIEQLSAISLDVFKPRRSSMPLQERKI